MFSAGAIVALVAIAAAAQWLAASYCAGNPAMRRWSRALALIALGWSALPVARAAYLDGVFPPVDGLEHERVARDVAALLASGEWGLACEEFGIGNRAYRFLLGVFYAVTGLPEVVTYALQGLLAFWGCVSVLDVLCRQTACTRFSLTPLALTCCAPSALFWTTWNLKEGVMLWGVSMMLRMTLSSAPAGARRETVLPVLGALAAGLLRPHIAVVVLGGIAVGAALAQRRFGLLAAAAPLTVAAGFAFAQLAPHLVERMASDGVGSTLNEQYAQRAQLGGSAIRHGPSGPMPVVSGLFMLFLRPYPTDVGDPVSAVAGLEIWGIAAIGIVGWLRLERRRRLALSPFLVTSFVTLLFFAFLFTYMYNMGLMVRQRVMAYPLIMSVVLAPTLMRASASARIVRAPRWQGVQPPTRIDRTPRIARGPALGEPATGAQAARR